MKQAVRLTALRRAVLCAIRNASLMTEGEEPRNVFIHAVDQVFEAALNEEKKKDSNSSCIMDELRQQCAYCLQQGLCGQHEHWARRIRELERMIDEIRRRLDMLPIRVVNRTQRVFRGLVNPKLISVRQEKDGILGLYDIIRKELTIVLEKP